MSEVGLRRILTEYVAHYHQSRTHLALDKDSPWPRPVAPSALGSVVVIPQVGGYTIVTTAGPRSHTI